MKNRNLWVYGGIGGLVLLIVAMLLYIAYLIITTPDEPARNVAFVTDNTNTGVTVLDPPRPRAEFTLMNSLGEPISLADLAGRPILISFGFTHCPDICPLTLQDMSRVRDQLGEQGDAIQYLFISVDGERDTPAVLQRYFQTLRVQDFMIGMTGTEAELRALAPYYGLEFIYGDRDANGNYSVDHTAGMFLLDENGQWIRRYTYGTQLSVIRADIASLLRS